jgi:hypothetical protein
MREHPLDLAIVILKNDGAIEERLDPDHRAARLA